MVTLFLQLQLLLGSGHYFLPTSYASSSPLLLALNPPLFLLDLPNMHPASSLIHTLSLQTLSPFFPVSAGTQIHWTMLFVKSHVGWAGYHVWTHIKILIIRAKNTVGVLFNLTYQWYSWRSGTASWEKTFYKDNPKHIWPNHRVQIITLSPGMGVGCGLQRSDCTGDADGKRERREAKST